MTKYDLTEQDRVYLNRAYIFRQVESRQDSRYDELSYDAHTLAERIMKSCPPSRERSLALTKLEEAVMWAKIAIARNE